MLSLRELNDKYWTTMKKMIFSLVALLVALSPVLSSCSSDEPDLLVGYYMEIQSSTAFMASSEDEDQGTMSDHDDANVLYTTVMGMKRALKEVYPEPRVDGNDAAVIAALDAVYRPYKAMYGQLERNTICVVKLYRTSMDGTIVVGS